MANLPAAQKALRVSKRKTARNQKARTRLSRITKKTMKLIELGESKLAEQQLPHLYKELDKAAKKRVIHPNKSARVKSKLTKKVSDTAKNVKAAPKNS